MAVMYFGETVLLTVTEFLVFPLVVLLFAISIKFNIVSISWHVIGSCDTFLKVFSNELNFSLN